MGLVHKQGNVYYYEFRREGGRVVSEYVGSGETAIIAHQQAQEERAQRQERIALKRAEIAAIDAGVEKGVDDLVALADAHLLASGFHKHKRQWRRRRHG